MNITSSDLRKKFLDYFEKRGHKILPNASLIPENDPSVLFTTAGMQQFKRYYLFPDEAPASNIATCQKCLRTGDIDEVGDETHLTFFEMLGNFSFGYPKKEGSYFKEEAIKMAWEFLTEELGISKDRITVAYFKGENEIPADDKSLEILKNIIGLSNDKIKGTGKDETFWSLGTEGSPGGPTVEFYVSPSEVSTKGDIDGIEVWNLVFNQYVLRDGNYIPSEYQGVDTGMGLERLLCVLNGESDVYKTDLFSPIIKKIEEISGKKYSEHTKEFRIISDHLRAAVALVADGVIPSNKDHGYILRRLIRRAIVKARQIGIEANFCARIAGIVCHPREVGDPLLVDSRLLGNDNIGNELEKEEEKFRKTLESGLQKIESMSKMFVGNFDGREWNEEKLKSTALDIFDLYQSDGFPVELSIEELIKRGVLTDDNNINQAKKMIEISITEHQEKSRTASAGMFRGGLADNKVETTRLHTAAHLLLAALRQVLSKDVNQKGSNITEERLRFDFNWSEKLTEDQIAQIEKIVNEKIKENIPVEMKELGLEEAKNSGATGVFDDRYGDKVKVYTIGNSSTSSGFREFFSREICGGPHIKNTSELGHFKITKEESSSAGVRRIKAILE